MLSLKKEQLKDEKKSTPLKPADLMDFEDEEELEIEESLLATNLLLAKKDGVMVLNEAFLAGYPKTVEQIDILITEQFESLDKTMRETRKVLMDRNQHYQLGRLYLELGKIKEAIDNTFNNLERCKTSGIEALYFSSRTDPLRKDVRRFLDMIAKLSTELAPGKDKVFVYYEQLIYTVKRKLGLTDSIVSSLASISLDSAGPQPVAQPSASLTSVPMEDLAPTLTSMSVSASSATPSATKVDPSTTTVPRDEKNSFSTDITALAHSRHKLSLLQARLKEDFDQFKIRVSDYSVKYLELAELDKEENNRRLRVPALCGRILDAMGTVLRNSFNLSTQLTQLNSHLAIIAQKATELLPGKQQSAIYTQLAQLNALKKEIESNLLNFSREFSQVITKFHQSTMIESTPLRYLHDQELPLRSKFYQIIKDWRAISASLQIGDKTITPDLGNFLRQEAASAWNKLVPPPSSSSSSSLAMSGR